MPLQLHLLCQSQESSCLAMPDLEVWSPPYNGSWRSPSTATFECSLERMLRQVIRLHVVHKHYYPPSLQSRREIGWSEWAMSFLHKRRCDLWQSEYVNLTMTDTHRTSRADNQTHLVSCCFQSPRVALGHVRSLVCIVFAPDGKHADKEVRQEPHYPYSTGTWYIHLCLLPSRRWSFLGQGAVVLSLHRRGLIDCISKYGLIWMPHVDPCQRNSR